MTCLAFAGYHHHFACISGKDVMEQMLPPDSPFTLFIVDGDPEARTQASTLISSLAIPCEDYSSPEDFLERFRCGQRGCVLLDACFEGMSGLQLQEELVRRQTANPIIFATAQADVRTTVRAMQNGALTVLEKPYRENDFCRSIRAAMEAEQKANESAARLAHVRERLATLDEREHKFVDLMIEGELNKNIAKILDISPRTADRIRASIYEKMGVESAAEVACQIAVLRAGLPVDRCPLSQPTR